MNSIEINYEDNNNERNQNLLKQQIKQLQEKLIDQQHQHKKILLKIKADLELESQHSKSLDEKYKNAMKYKNQESAMKKILHELNDKLSQKENQIVEFMKVDQEKNKKNWQLKLNINDLTMKNQQLQQQIQQLQQVAVNQLIEKDNTISEMNDKLQDYQNDSIKNIVIELENKCKQFQDKQEQLENKILEKDEQISLLNEKIEFQKQSYEEKIGRLEQQVHYYQKRIQEIKELKKYQDSNLEQQYEQMINKMKANEYKMQNIIKQTNQQTKKYLSIIQKLQNDLNEAKKYEIENKKIKQQIKQLKKQQELKTKQIQQLKINIEKITTNYFNKLTILESDKKKLSEIIEQLTHQKQLLETKIDKYYEQNYLKHENNVSSSSLANQIKLMSDSPKNKNQYNHKKQIGELEKHICTLNGEIERQSKEIQILRQQIVEGSGSASHTDQMQKLQVKIQDLHTYIKKLQSSLMLNKLQHVEDRDYWSIKQKQLIDEIEVGEANFKKQKLKLLELIDRAKKNQNKDNKINFYQSSLK